MPLLDDHTAQSTAPFEKAAVKQANGYASHNDAESLTSSLKDVNVAPLWAQMARLNPELPNPKTKPFLWEYNKIRPYLLDSGRLIKEAQAERRVLMLVNPERGKAGNRGLSID